MLNQKVSETIKIPPGVNTGAVLRMGQKGHG